MITVACTKRDPKCFNVPKYDNDEPWNVVNGMAPNGVCATRHLRKTDPDKSKLCSLALFLVENCPNCVAGRMPAFNHSDRVYCYNGLTEAENALRECVIPVHGRYPANGKTMWFKTADEAIAMQKNYIRCYGMSEPMKIDWLFSIADPECSDEYYWNVEAGKMLAAGTVRVVIGSAEWRL